MLLLAELVRGNSDNVGFFKCFTVPVLNTPGIFQVYTSVPNEHDAYPHNCGNSLNVLASDVP